MTLGDFLCREFVHGMPIDRPMSLQTFMGMGEGAMRGAEVAHALNSASTVLTSAIERGEARHAMGSYLAERIAKGLPKLPGSKEGELVARVLPVLEDVMIGDDRKAGVAHWIGLLAIGEA